MGTQLDGTGAQLGPKEIRLQAKALSRQNTPSVLCLTSEGLLKGVRVRIPECNSGSLRCNFK